MQRSNALVRPHIGAGSEKVSNMFNVIILDALAML
jgi:hypothetical protein